MYTGLQLGIFWHLVPPAPKPEHMCVLSGAAARHMVGKCKIIGLVKMNLRSGVVIAASGVLYLCLKLSVVTTTLAEQQISVCMCVQGSLHLLLMACSEVNDFIVC